MHDGVVDDQQPGKYLCRLSDVWQVGWPEWHQAGRLRNPCVPARITSRTRGIKDETMRRQILIQEMQGRCISGGDMHPLQDGTTPGLGGVIFRN
jgi:hypothetical protein